MIRNHPTLLHRLSAALLSLCILASAGCARGQVVPGPTPGPDSLIDPTASPALPPSGATPDAALGSAEAAPDSEAPEGDPGEARFVDQPLEPPVVDVPSLGSASFTVDPSNRVVGEATARGGDLELQLTDSAGLTWSLRVPALAMGAPQVISMTALTDLDRGDITGNLVGGVLLEPDGLQFDAPVTLSVAGAALRGTTLILGGAPDGSEMAFTLPGDADAGASALLLHFSAYAADDLDDPQIAQMLEQARQQYKALADQARALLKDGDIDVPRPPSVPLRCTDEDETRDNQESLDAFARAFGDPEMTLIGKMLAAQRNLQLLGEPDTGFSLEVRLLGRQARKARLLIDEYGQDVDNLPAITSAVLGVARNLQLLGGDDDGTAGQLVAELPALYERAIEALLDELVADHEYRNIGAILEAARALQLLGSSSGYTTEALFERLAGALNFDLELTYTAQLVDNQHWVLEASFPVSFDTSGVSVSTLIGSGTGSLISFVHDDWPELYVVAPDFEVGATVEEFLPCEGTAKVTLNQFFPPSETYKADDPDEPMSLDMPLIKGIWEGAFADFAGDGRYAFPVEIRNEDVEAADETLEAVSERSGGNAEATIEIKLVHSPRGGR